MYTSILRNCPNCGKPNSAYEYGFCGECEEEYRREKARRNRAEYEAYFRRIEKACPDGDAGEVLTYSQWLGA